VFAAGSGYGKGGLDEWIRGLSTRFETPHTAVRKPRWGAARRRSGFKTAFSCARAPQEAERKALCLGQRARIENGGEPSSAIAVQSPNS